MKVEHESQNASMASQHPTPEHPPYELLGGEATIRKLVKVFYETMDSIPEAWETRKLHPQDLSNAEDKLFKFLSGWLGGPDLYVQEFGHPMLRRRHLPFSISSRERDQWLLCMAHAMDALEITGPLRTYLDHAFRNTADHMRNQADLE